MQAKQPRSRLIVCKISPPSRTRTHRLLGTPAYQTAFSESRQMPSGTPSPRSAHTRRFERPPLAPMSKAVSFLPYDSATIRVELSGVTAMPLGKAMPSPPAGGAVGCDNGDGPRDEIGAGHQVETCRVDIRVGATLYDDLIPAKFAEAGQIGMDRQRSVGFEAQDTPAAQAALHRRTNETVLRPHP